MDKYVDILVYYTRLRVQPDIECNHDDVIIYKCITGLLYLTALT